MAWRPHIDTQVPALLAGLVIVAEDTCGAAARPASAKTPPSFPYSCQPNQLSRHLCGDMRPLGQLSKHLRGGMQIFMKTLPPCQLSSLPAYMAMHASLAWTRVGARRSGDGWDGLPCHLLPLEHCVGFPLKTKG